MKPYSQDERENMNTFGDPSTPYFYTHLPIIYELMVLIPLTSFEIELLNSSNIAPSQITLNV